MCKLVLNPEEIGEIKALLSHVTANLDSVEDPQFLDMASVYAHELPQRVRSFLNHFRLREPEGICTVAGYPVPEEKIGCTPEHWRLKPPHSPTLEEEVLLVLLGSLLGDIIGWSTQQDGRIVHDVFPIKGHESEQLGSGSEQLLWWHTEDAFHPYRADYLGLMCLRNPDRVATTVGTIDSLALDPERVEPLFKPLFTIRPDESHLKKNNSKDRVSDPRLQHSYERIERMNESPEAIPVLFGDPTFPYMRLDPFFMDPVTDEEGRKALEYFVSLMDNNIQNVILEAGDFIFIDNFRAVHGRRPFRARFDGRDRWLKRINVARDLRKSKDLRAGTMSRVIL